tara:strand:+ start:231 stop:659 length:429 start_codon:yes stop_codon:yes gene_type:complete
MSYREDFAANIVQVLTNMDDPKPVLVTREPFDVEKLAISQFPAIMISSGSEERIDQSMGILRTGTIEYTIRCFVRGGPDLDRQKNNLIERVEETLDLDRTRGSNLGKVTTQVLTIEVPDRLSPLAETVMTVQVRYSYKKGTV